ncbi:MULTISPECIES: Dyp-type peroxidase [Streptomyces]|uniref:Dyp-type peroxidase n=2 Tax=Streptomyces TaxID=1883 RepID=A0ABU4K1V6_9ACTN|nr:Dyp-type peroxidase [Streptomyces roseolus]MDX2291735.1 Dyp-type peroxidase [Streptomyces roseolus]
MAFPQPVLGPPAKAALFLTLTVAPGRETDVREGLRDLSGLTRSVAFRARDEALACVAGLASDAWDRLVGGPRPRELHPFTPLQGPRHLAPATPGDLLLHLRARRPDLCFELARVVLDRFGDAVTVVDETHGFTYFDDRDLLGFVDGSENPVGPAAPAAVLVADEDPDFRGGSYVVAQKYLHDMTAWNALPTEEQERVIGRSKADNVELPDGVQPSDSHVALTTVEDADGEELRIVRQNMPFGRLGTAEFGTYFIGYARTPAVTERMLRNMFLGDPPGNTDRILDFSTAVTGGLFFAPSADLLDDLPAPGPAEEPLAEPAPPEALLPADAVRPAISLGIGSLKGAPAS